MFVPAIQARKAQSARLLTVLDGCLKTVLLKVNPSIARNRLVRKGYRNLSIRNELYEELERFVSESRGRYVSVAEVIREAVRDFLERKRSGTSKKS